MKASERDRRARQRARDREHRITGGQLAAAAKLVDTPARIKARLVEKIRPRVQVDRRLIWLQRQQARGEAQRKISEKRRKLVEKKRAE